MARDEQHNQNNRFFTKARQGHYFLLTLLLIALYGTYKIFEPYLHALILAAVLASVFYPVYQFFLRKTRTRRNISALATCLCVALVVILPIAAFTASLVDKSIDSFQAVKEWVQENKISEFTQSERFTKFVQSDQVQRLLDLRDRTPLLRNITVEELESRAATVMQTIISYIGGNALPLVENVFALCINFLLMLFIMFYFLRDGTRILKFLMQICPLPTEHEELLIERVKIIGKSAVLGTLLTAVAQGILGMIAFAVVGIPWFFWGVVMGFASLVPVVGTALVWIPCVGYLFLTGATGEAIGLAIWCAIVVNSADNFLRPFLMQGDTGLSSMIVFFALLGGIQLFGLIGVIYGPLILGLCAVLLYIYELETRAAQPANAGGGSKGRNRRSRSRGNRGGGGQGRGNSPKSEDDHNRQGSNRSRRGKPNDQRNSDRPDEKPA